MAMGFDPITVIASAALLGAVVCFVFAIVNTGLPARVAFTFVGVVLLVPPGVALAIHKPELIDARYRAYKRLYDEIRPGMTRAEVWKLVDETYPSSGTRLRPTVLEDSDTALKWFMNPEMSTEPNCEGIFLELHQDRVVRKRYSRD